MSGLDEIVNFCQQLDWESLPGDVRERALMAYTDNFGSLLAGRGAPVSRIAADYAAETWAEGEATIFVTGRQRVPEGASFANATATNSWDIDDCGLFTKGHPGAVVFPTVLSLGEELGVDGKKILLAMILGYEVGLRVARCWHDYHETFRAGGSWGSVVSAAVSSYMLGLPKSESKQALKVAEYNSPYIPIDRVVYKPGMVKHGLGVGAQEGIRSARLAKMGYTGADSILKKEEYKSWLSDLGEDYLLEGGVVWKEYASCAWTHPALDAVKKILAGRDIDPERISSVEVRTHRPACNLGTDLPETTEEAQFNLAWPIAALLSDGEVGPPQVEEERLSDPALRELVERVNARESKRLTELYEKAVRGEPGGKHAARVKLITVTGEEFRSGLVEGNICYPPRGWNRAKIDDKFLWLVGGTDGSDKASGLLRTIEDIAAVKDVRTLVDDCLDILAR